MLTCVCARTNNIMASNLTPPNYLPESIALIYTYININVRVRGKAYPLLYGIVHYVAIHHRGRGHTGTSHRACGQERGGCYPTTVA